MDFSPFIAVLPIAMIILLMTSLFKTESGRKSSSIKGNEMFSDKVSITRYYTEKDL